MFPAAALTLSLLVIAAGTALPPTLEEPWPGEWAVFSVTPNGGESWFTIELTSEGHAYATVFAKHPTQGWGAPKTLSTSTVAAGTSIGPPARADANVPLGGLTASMGVGVPGPQAVLIVVVVYGEVAEWSYSTSNLTVVEMNRGTGVRALDASGFDRGAGASVETMFPGVDVAADLEVAMDLSDTGFGFLGAVDVIDLLAGKTMETSIVTPEGVTEPCPCQFYGDETRPDLSVMNMVALKPGHYIVRASGQQVHTLAKLPLLVVADIPDPTL